MPPELAGRLGVGGPEVPVEVRLVAEAQFGSDHPWPVPGLQTAPALPQAQLKMPRVWGHPHGFDEGADEVVRTQ